MFYCVMDLSYGIIIFYPLHILDLKQLIQSQFFNTKIFQFYFVAQAGSKRCLDLFRTYIHHTSVVKI